jgi:integrase
MATKARTTLSARTVASIEASEGQRLVIVDRGKGSVPGLELRVTPDQSKSWSIRYYRKADGKRRRFTLGTYPEMGLEEARRECLDILRDVRHGHDPAHARELRKGADTFKALAEDYLKAVAKRRTHREMKRILEHDWFPEIGAMKAAEVPRRKIIEVLDAIVERGAPVTANRALGVVRQVYLWALSKAKLESVPVTGIRRPHEEKSRSRALSADEIKVLWDGLGTSIQSEAVCDVIRLALILGQRVGEICGMKADELDIDKKVWVLPTERVKNKEAHAVPLPDMALSIILPRLERGGKYIFPGPNAKHMNPKTPIKNLARNLEKFGIEHFVVHDLRRTLNTHLARLGVSSEIRSHILNHTSGKRGSITESVYNVYAYDEEKRRALAIWTTELERIVEDRRGTANVIAMGERR